MSTKYDKKKIEKGASSTNRRKQEHKIVFLLAPCRVMKGHIVDLVQEALTDAEIKLEFSKIVMDCVKDHPVPMNDLIPLQQMVPPRKKEVKCLLACAYKQEGTMNAEGLYDIEHAYKVAELAKNGDEERLKNGKKIADICVKVNEVEVSDGNKGCERAGLIFKCVAENAPKYGFKI